MTENISYNDARREIEQLRTKARRKSIALNSVQYLLMTVLAVILLVPYVYMINRSLMTAENAKYSFDFFTKDWPFSASLIAYSFAKLKWKGRNTMFFLMLGTMMLPAAVTQLPLYVMYSKSGIFGNGGFNWLDTIYPFTIPNLFGGGAVYIFLMRQYMLGIPKDFDDAAKIDGANTFQRYLFITLPLCQPVILYVMSQVFINYWGDYYGPMVYCDSGELRTLAQVVYYSTNSTDRVGSIKDNIVMAGAVFMSIIPTIIFAIFQKQLIEGVAMSGIKG